jgi:hypothetical protein
LFTFVEAHRASFLQCAGRASLSQRGPAFCFLSRFPRQRRGTHMRATVRGSHPWGDKAWKALAKFSG